MARRKIATGALLAAALSATVLLAACGSGSSNQLSNSDQLAHKTADINPQDPSTLVDGNFVWPLDAWEPNWNGLETDGTDENEPLVYDAYLPRFFLVQADGTTVINHDYLTSATVSTSGPQVVTYEINPKAHWSDGTPITWHDLYLQWQANNGSNPAFEEANPTGYNDISSVAEGRSPTEAVLTFSKPFAEWQYLFSRFDPLYPPAVNATPSAFNTSLLNGPSLTSGGPFVVQSYDQNKQSITMVRNPTWWGAKPVLSRIIFLVVNRDNRADDLANGAITNTPLFSDADLYKRAQKMPNVTIHESIADNFNDFWFNGRTGALFADVKLRTAIATGVDSTAFTKAIIGTIEPNPVPIGNHVYLPGVKYHEDHSSALSYDLTRAKSGLDADGWVVQPGKQYRTKNGQELDVSILDTSDTGDPVDAETNKLLFSQLATLGVKAVLNAVPNAQYNSLLDKGQWDMTSQGWIVSPFAISGSEPNYFLDPNNINENFSQIGSQQINNLYNEANATLDPDKRAQLGNQIDTDLWQLAIDIPEFQSPGVMLTNSKVANFGAFGFSDIDYTKIGFMK